MNNQIKTFIDQLSQEEVETEKVFNQYHEEDNFPQFFTTKLNLLFYLTQMKEKQPKTILVGEAPGKDGCALTGIPFTSTQIMSTKSKFGLFGFQNQEDDNLKKERTATMIWKVLFELNFCPLLWNAYPFNPFDPKTGKNRMPTYIETEIGKKYLVQILELFNIKNIVAIGNTSDYLIKRMGIEHFKVSHPSFGNQKKFYEGLKDLLNNREIE